MSLKYLTFIFAYICNSFVCQSQIILEFGIYDSDTKMAIADAHVFLANSTFGTISDANGQVNIRLPDQKATDLLITHLSYEVKTVANHDIEALVGIDSIFLIKSSFDLSEVTISSMSKRKRKKSLKKFKKYFLGDNDMASKCHILNPEVIHFKETGKTLTARASDLIKIHNEHLDYMIEFHLISFSHSPEETSYLGKAFFTELGSGNVKKIKENRQAVFETSSRHFMKSLIQNKLVEHKYDIEVQSYTNGKFTTLYKPTSENLILYDSIQNEYKIAFTEFLQITNKQKKKIKERSLGRMSKAETSKFGGLGGNQVAKMDISYDVSHLYKTSTYLRIDHYGNILNNKNVKEYGAWADQRIAHLLPWDYGEIIINDSKINTTKDLLGLSDFLSLLQDNGDIRTMLLNTIKSDWNEVYTAPILEIIRMTGDEKLSKELLSILQEKHGKENIPNYYEGLRWLWSKDACYPDYYGDLKANIYQYIDPEFHTYFHQQQATADIRLDEILWGGVKQDGIPPLRYPSMNNTKSADYLDDDNIIFGVVINGIPKAYPKRILAWHEFFVDSFGKNKIAGVYCTLCGTVIAYDMTHRDTFYDLGTSGFLYRSNKLMYDKNTSSLWNTITGRPVVGPLTGEDITLHSYPVITTTWKEWKTRYPHSQVLSLDTGHERDYSEGKAYNAYFSTDELMFPVPEIDARLRNKDEVLVIKVNEYENDPIAISTSFLQENEVFNLAINQKNYVIVTRESGGSQVYESGEHQFTKIKNDIIITNAGEDWKISDEALLSSSKERLARVSSHRSFWFAWYNMFPNTRLIK